MKTLAKYILLLAGICLLFACHEYKGGAEIRKQERDTLSSYAQIMGGGEDGPAALRVIPGSSWRFWKLSDSTFAILSQDTSNSLQSIIREDSLLAWINANASFTLATQVDSVSVMLSGTYPVGTRIVNKATGAIYKIQATAVTGYTTDSLLVVPTSDAYAILESYSGNIYFSHVNQAGSDDTEVLRKMMQYAYVQANKKISTVVIDEDAYLTDTLMIPATVSLYGTYKNIRTRTNDGRYTTLYLNLNDANKTAITTEDHVYAAADQYFPGGEIAHLNIEAISPGHTIFRLIRPGWMQIHDLRIGSGPTQPTNFSTRYYDYAFRFDDALKTKFYDIEIRNCKKWAFWSFDGGGTTFLDNVRLDGNVNGIKADTSNLVLTNCIIENADSTGLKVYGGDVLVDYTHFETVPNSAIAVSPIQLGGGAGSLTMRSVRMNSPFLAAHASLVCIETDDFDYLWVRDCEFHNYPTQLSTTASQGQIFWENEHKTGITNAVSTGAGVTNINNFYYNRVGTIIMPGMTNGLVGATNANQLINRSYTAVADSLSSLLSPLLGGGSLTATTQMDLNNNGLWIEDTGGGHVTIGNATNYGRGILQLNGVGYSASGGFAVANQTWYRGYTSGGTDIGIARITSANDLEIGSVSNDLTLLFAGTNAADYFNFNVGNVARTRIYGDGELRHGAPTVDNGAELAQFTGDVYIDDVLRLKPTTAPGTPLFGMIYLSSVDSSLYLHNGTTWVQLDN